LRENAGIADVFGTDASITQKTITTAVRLATMLVFATRPFIRLPSKSCPRVADQNPELTSQD